jgi:hypothetical protein
MAKAAKKKVRMLLRQRAYKEFIHLCLKDTHYLKELRFCLYEADEGLRFSAIEAIANLMEKLWQIGEEEKVREYMRMLFWSLNDESGGIGWSAPQIIAEIIIRIPELINPYGSMMIFHSLREPFLIKSGLWGIGRLGKRIRDELAFFKKMVLEVFGSKDPQVLGLAAWALGEACFKPAIPFLNEIEKKDLISIYIDGNFYEKPLGQWAKEAMAKILREN